MLEKLQFYIRHSLNDLRVNGQRTLFALLCIAAGVAAIVSLQTLAVMIENSLTGNLQENNRGDIQFQPGSDFLSMGSEDAMQQGVEAGLLVADTRSFFGQEISQYRLGEAGLAALQTWINDDYPGQIAFTYRQPLTDLLGVFLGGGRGTTLVSAASGEQVAQLSPVVVDTSVYPFYSQIVTLDGSTLDAVMQVPADVVVSEDVAEQLDLAVGDTVQLNGSDADFTVRGIVTTEAEVKDPTSDAFAALFGFYYLDLSAVELFDGVTVSAELVYLELDPALDVLEVEASLNETFPFVLTTTTEDLRQNYADLASNINQLVSVMGLVSLLIGSIGIINTMQVIVRRRTVEIAVLKTIGLQADQVTILFMVEALLMGIVGSLAGIVLGWAATFFIRGAAEALFATSLGFVLAPLPALNGFLVGTLVTAIFGFLPTLSAGQVRPSIVLRPTDMVIPRAGLLRSLAALIVIILALSLVATSILGSFSTAFQVTVYAFVAAGILYGVLSLLIWLIGRFFPSLGVIDLKISLRQMLAGRTRAAVTLLALVVGVFSLSLITLMAQSIGSLLEYSLETGVGGNILITASSQAQVNMVEDMLAEQPGVNSYRVNESYSLAFQYLEEGATGTQVSREELGERLAALNQRMQRFGDDGEELNWLQLLDSEIGTISTRTVEELPDETFAEGRQLTAEDATRYIPGLILIGSNRLDTAGIHVGDRLTYTFPSGGGLMGGLGGGSEEAAPITFEVIGITATPALNMNFGTDVRAYVLPEAFPPDRAPNNLSIVVDIDEEYVSALRRELAGVPGVFALETAVITRLINSLLGTFTAFPTMVAGLGLIVGGVVIANSVALTTMERRREIAIMKAVGLQRERVLFMLLLENGILGLIGGLIGVGIGLLALTLLVASFGAPGSALPIGTALLLMLLCIIVALVASMTTAWGASGEKPLNVLRYE
ncbi:MAG: ABC transporter permease [Anaerolineae bacterium]|nr:ABC transporter permease [Anaerolineae bacterium]